MAKVLFLVDPNSTTSIKDVSKGANGDFVSGRKDDINCLQVEKFADFKVALEMADRIEQRLSFAFMLNTAIQRDGERVTAEEIRYMARELEDVLGGTYSVLSQDLQRPTVEFYQRRLARQGKLPELPKEAIKLVITTGIEALGRSHELNKLNMFMQEMEPIKERFIPKVNVDDYANRVATGVGINIEGLLISDEVLAQQAQQDQMNAVMAQGVVDVVPKVADKALEDADPQALRDAVAGAAGQYLNQ